MNAATRYLPFIGRLLIGPLPTRFIGTRSGHRTCCCRQYPSSAISVRPDVGSTKETSHGDPI
jgi:hypothetical protein